VVEEVVFEQVSQLEQCLRIKNTKGSNPANPYDGFFHVLAFAGSSAK
jgi:hypothetical protein